VYLSRWFTSLPQCRAIILAHLRKVAGLAVGLDARGVIYEVRDVSDKLDGLCAQPHGLGEIRRDLRPAALWRMLEPNPTAKKSPSEVVELRDCSHGDVVRVCRFRLGGGGHFRAASGIGEWHGSFLMITQAQNEGLDYLGRGEGRTSELPCRPASIHAVCGLAGREGASAREDCRLGPSLQGTRCLISQADTRQQLPGRPNQASTPHHSSTSYDERDLVREKDSSISGDNLDSLNERRCCGPFLPTWGDEGVEPGLGG